MAKKDSFEMEDMEITRMEREIKQRKRKKKAFCPHCHKGNPRFQKVGDRVFKCKMCKEIVDMRGFKGGSIDDSIEVVKDHVDEVVNDLQCLKVTVASNGKNGVVENKKLLQQISTLIFNLENTPSIFKAILKSSKKNRKKDKHNGGNRITFGKSSLFNGGSGKKKNKW